MGFGSNGRSKKQTIMTNTFTSMPAALLFLLLISLAALLLLFLHSPSTSTSTTAAAASNRWSGDLRDAEFSWNSLRLDPDHPPPVALKIAVFSRKWPVVGAPGGMERHALTLHSALARRGHRVHVFTSAPPSGDSEHPISSGELESREYPRLHFLSSVHWKCDEAWGLFEQENLREPFDVVHSESVALHHRVAAGVPNLAVSWHGISLEALHSGIYQDLVRGPGEPMSPAFNRSLSTAIYKVLDEIRFFQRYAHHVAISDSTGEMLRDVYQIPRGRVHVILNGVDEDEFRPDPALGSSFLAEIGVPSDAALVFGVAGRLVKDKGHPLLHAAFAKLVARHPDVYLVVAGTGPWAQRYAELGPRVVALGALPASRLRAFYNAVDAFVNPTLRPQGLDLTLMEAMRCGTPVVVTRFPSIKGSVVVDAEFGHMFAPNAEALEAALEAAVTEGRGRMRERGAACAVYGARMFTAGKMALAYERLFLCIKDQGYCQYPLPNDGSRNLY